MKASFTGGFLLYAHVGAHEIAVGHSGVQVTSLIEHVKPAQARTKAQSTDWALSFSDLIINACVSEPS